MLLIKRLDIGLSDVSEYLKAVSDVCVGNACFYIYSPATSGTIINACAVLHNMMLDRNLALPSEEEINFQINNVDDHENDDGF